MDNGLGVLVWIPIISIIGTASTVMIIVSVVTRARLRRAEMRAEVQMKLVDKFGSSAEFVKFLESPAGLQFLEQPRRATRDRALGGLTAGLVTTFMGLAFLLCAAFLRDSGFLVPAFILTGIGLAFLISTLISWKLTKKWTGTSPMDNP